MDKTKRNSTKNVKNKNSYHIKVFESGNDSLGYYFEKVVDTPRLSKVKDVVNSALIGEANRCEVFNTEKDLVYQAVRNGDKIRYTDLSKNN